MSKNKQVKKPAKAYGVSSSVSAAVFTAISELAGIASVLLSVYLVSRLWGGPFSMEQQEDLAAEILMLGFIVLALQLIKALSYAFALWRAHDNAYSSLLGIRLALITHLMKLPLSFFQERKTGELAEIVDHDVERIELYLAHTLPEALSCYLVCGFSFVTILVLDWRLALVLLAIVPVILLIFIVGSPFWKSSIGAYQESMHTVSSNIMEYIHTIPAIKAFGSGETRTQTMLASIDDYIAKARKAIYAQTLPMGVVSVLVEGSVGLLAIVGCLFLAQGSLAAEDITRFIVIIILGGMFTQGFMKAMTLTYNKTVYEHTMGSVRSVIDEPLPPRQEEETNYPVGEIVLEEVSFSYNGEAAALQELSLSFPVDSQTAIVGPSGAGKSTLAGLLTGARRIGKGRLTIGGRDLSELSEANLMSLVSIVQQDSFLLNVSLAENIRIGKPNASDEEVILAAKAARIHEVISSLPEGYNTRAGEAGSRLSGGEKQRISLARMILKDAPIVILDEATAAVDPYNEALIQGALAKLCAGKTLIVIAHHLRTVQNLERIVVLEEGRVSGSGTHLELLENNPLYRELWEAQLTSERWSIKGGDAL